LCHLQHKLIGFYNRDEKCLQRGTDWVFKQNSLRFVFKGLTHDPARTTATTQTLRVPWFSLACTSRGRRAIIPLDHPFMN